MKCLMVLLSFYSAHGETLYKVLLEEREYEQHWSGGNYGHSHNQIVAWQVTGIDGDTGDIRHGAEQYL